MVGLVLHASEMRAKMSSVNFTQCCTRLCRETNHTYSWSFFCIFCSVHSCVIKPVFCLQVASSDSLAWPRRSTPLPQLPARNGVTHHILPNFIRGGPPAAPPPPGSRWRNSPVTPHGCTTLSHSPSLSLSDWGNFIGTNSCTCLIASIFFLDVNKNPWLDVSYL